MSKVILFLLVLLFTAFEIPPSKASIIFLPDYLEKNPSVIMKDPCVKFPLPACPPQGYCSRCALDFRRFKLESCASGYIIKNNFCIKKSCPDYDKTYLAAIPYGQVCISAKLEDLTCYKDCRPISCVGYTLDCNILPEHATALTKCPDCQSSASKCGNYVCKISQCENGYKIANNGTECLQLDDTCPQDYFKTCETGILTTATPIITEAGNKCYKCKPKPQQCPINQWDLDNYWCNGALRCWLPQIN